MSLLEEFWYGNIEPMEYDTSLLWSSIFVTFMAKKYR